MPLTLTLALTLLFCYAVQPFQLYGSSEAEVSWAVGLGDLVICI